MTDGEDAVRRTIKAATTELELVDAAPPEFSQEDLALQYAKRHADDLRHVAKWGQWWLWDGSRWREDTTLRAFDLARAICRSASSEADKPSLKREVASAKAVAATVSLGRADRRLAATVDQWDADLWELLEGGEK
jgi:putative DNA primase/helicase